MLFPKRKELQIAFFCLFTYKNLPTNHFFVETSRFKIDGEIVSSWSNSSTVSRIFMETGRHIIEVTARNTFGTEATADKTFAVVESFEIAQFNCPAVSVPGAEIVCRGEWHTGSGAVEFDYGDDVLEIVQFGMLRRIYFYARLVFYRFCRVFHTNFGKANEVLQFQLLCQHSLGDPKYS